MYICIHLIHTCTYVITYVYVSLSVSLSLSLSLSLYICVCCLFTWPLACCLSHIAYCPLLMHKATAANPTPSAKLHHLPYTEINSLTELHIQIYLSLL